MEVFNPNSNINFLGWRKISMTISAVLVVIALAAITLIVISTGWVPQSRITIVSAGPYLLFLTVFYVLMKKNKAANRMAP